MRNWRREIRARLAPGATSALRLCAAGHSWMALYESDLLHLVAVENVNPEGAEAIRRQTQLPLPDTVQMSIHFEKSPPPEPPEQLEKAR